MLDFDETPEFKKEIKKLSKKWRSIPIDLARARKVISSLYIPQAGVTTEQLRKEMFSGNKATLLSSSDNYEIVKMRLLCKDLKTDKIVRIIFIFVKTKNSILLVELYAHNNKSREDEFRINRYLKHIVLNA